MNKIFGVLEKYLMKPMSKIAQYKVVRAIMAAGLASIPFTIMGSIFLVINILPMVFPGLQSLFDNTLFRVSDLYMIANSSTMGILGIFFAIVVGYEYTKLEAAENGTAVNSLTGALLALFAFFMCVPELVLDNGKIQLVNTINDSEKVVSGFRIGSAIDRLGTAGIFTAILTALLAVSIYCFCVRRNLVIKLPDGVPAGVSRAFASLIPLIFITIIILIFNGILISMGTDIVSLVSLPFGFVTKLTDSWLGICIIYFLIHALWLVGIHGSNIITSILMPIALTNMQANIDGANYVYAAEFNSSYVFIGGVGSLLGLTIFIAFFAKADQLRILGKASLPSVIFNICEPVMFGLPIVYNPYMAIPFFLAPTASASLAYAAIKLSFASPLIANVPWPLPVGVAGFLGSGGDWRNAVLAVACALVAFAIHYPFIKYYDAKLYKEENENASEPKITEEKAENAIA